VFSVGADAQSARDGLALLDTVSLSLTDCVLMLVIQQYGSSTCAGVVPRVQLLRCFYNFLSNAATFFILLKLCRPTIYVHFML